MARYISPIQDLALYSNGGDLLYVFDNGTLDLGSGVTIDATEKTPDSDSLALVFPNDISGDVPGDGTFSRIEAAGQGDLTNRITGIRNFYLANDITPGSATVSTTAGLDYLVLTGSVVYNGVTYNTNQVFTSNGTAVDTSTTNSGTFRLEIPIWLKKKTEEFQEEAFRLKMFDRENQANYAPGTALGYTANSDWLSRTI